MVGTMPRALLLASALAALALAAPAAYADPTPAAKPATDEPTPTWVTGGAKTPSPATTPTATPAASPAERQHEAVAPAAWMAPPTVFLRPQDVTIAIGIGYGFHNNPNNTTTTTSSGTASGNVTTSSAPTSLLAPNTVSARVRFPSGVTLEPTLVLKNDSSTVDMGGMTMAQTEAITTLTLGSVVRVPLIERGHTDLELLGNASVTSYKDDPPGDNNTLTSTTFTLGWGVGAAYWITAHWQVSVSATNPLINYTKATQQTGAGMSTSTSTSSIGASFDPTVTAMIHLYN